MANPQKKRGFFSRLSLAAKASWVLALFLVLLVIVVWIAFLVIPEHLPWRDAMTTWRVLSVLALVAVIPYVCYHALRLWLEGEKSRFPDIDFAFKSGIEALRRNGLALDSVPIFLVLGSPNERQEKSIMAAAGMGLRVQGVPEGPSPLHWYANPDGVYIFCSGVGWLTALAALSEKRGPGGSTGVISDAVDQFSSFPIEEEEADEPIPASAPAAATSAPPSSGTIMLDQFIPTQSEPRNQPAGGSGGERGQSKSIALQQPVAMATQRSQVRTASSTHSFSPVSAGSQSGKPLLVAAQDAAEQTQRLQYLCQLLKNARDPLCSINGLLTLLPFENLQATQPEVEELQKAVRSDLLAVQRGLGLRCPVTALVVGLEKEQGFQELVRRVGQDRVGQRFGKRFDVRSLAGPEELSALCVHVCGAFEDWVYTLFREQGSLSKPGNTRLYSLLCKVRCNLKTRLNQLLGGGYAFEAEHASGDDPFLFSGCYFAATGDKPASQAFVRDVFLKLTEEQENIEWSQQAANRQKRHQTLAYIGMALSGILLVTLFFMIFQRYF